MKSDVIIKSVYPEIDGGIYPVKTEVDRDFKVTAYISSGKTAIKPYVKYRKKGLKTWMMAPMKQIDREKWEGFVNLEPVGNYEYTVEIELVKTGEEIEYNKVLEAMAEPVRARYSAWYEMFHRSQGKVPGKSATFKDMKERLPEIKKMGFDVIYLPPVHPVGRKNRKGPNNKLWAGPDDPGCPWSIGNEYGGHKAVNPELGTLEDFDDFVKNSNEMGIEIALDIALTTSFDHPYITEHPNWFFHNPDGTIKFAENPPKKYEDTVLFNFYPEDKDEMWDELKSIFVFWIKHGVKIFRIDNPHTKPDEFWGWVIRDIKKKYPEVLMLAEAFTKYEKLELLAKLGFSQSYTYFTWRNKKNEIIEYCQRLTSTNLKDFLRANFFANTPDILPEILQVGGRPAFKMRAVLAGTLSSVYGIYNGFELCEGRVTAPGKEEYLDSEKYEYKVWDWDRPGNIKDFIAKLNKIRKQNPALQLYDNLKFYPSTDENVLFYGKMTPDRKNVIFVAVNLNPFGTQASRLTVPLEELGIGSGDEYTVKELITDTDYKWKGRENYVIIDPNAEPAQIFRIEKS